MANVFKDIRIGLVLYGGVSLAVYMNGTVREVWDLLRASRAKTDPVFAGGADLSPIALEWISVLEEIEQKTGCPPLRVVVDAIAGTSAGGINGVVLGKAILEGADLTPLTATWINQADVRVLKVAPPHGIPWTIRQVVNGLLWLKTSKETRKELDHVLTMGDLDRKWLYGTLYSAVVSDDGRYTPLSGDTFTQLLADALEAMDGKKTGPLVPADTDLDLFVTRTDLFGWPRPLPLTSEYQASQLFERTHAHMAHFKGRPSKNAKLDNFDLTYCARTTASFPVAFPLETHETVATAWSKKPGRTLSKARIAAFIRAVLREHALSGSPLDRAWMADGGIENNHPFTQLIGAIERKPVAREVHRAILYLEPDPADLNPAHWGKPEDWTGNPDDPFPPAAAPPITKTAAQLIGLISNDPIYKDLRNLKERDITVQRLRADRDWILQISTKHVERWLADLPHPLSLEDFSSLLDRASQTAMAATDQEPTPDAIIYTRVKVRAVLDGLGVMLAEVLAYPAPSRQGQFLARLLKSWVQENLPHILESMSPDSIRQDSPRRPRPDDPRSFLSTFDIAYRARWVRAVTDSVNEAYRTQDLTGTQAEALDNTKAALATLLDRLDEPWHNQALLTKVFGPTASPQTLGDRISEILGANDQDTLDTYIESTLRFDFQQALNDHQASLDQVWQLLARLYEAASENHRTDLYNALQHLPEEHGIRKRVINTAISFAFVDRSLFPRMHTAGILGLVSSEVMRLSPRDSTAISTNPRRIKSAGLGAFAGFLNQDYREQDILWGRADGMERLLKLILSAAGRDGSDKNDEDWIKQLLARLLKKAVEEHEKQGWTVPTEIETWLASRSTP